MISGTSQVVPAEHGYITSLLYCIPQYASKRWSSSSGGRGDGVTARPDDCQVFVATKTDIFKETFAHFPAKLRYFKLKQDLFRMLTKRLLCPNLSGL